MYLNIRNHAHPVNAPSHVKRKPYQGTLWRFRPSAEWPHLRQFQPWLADESGSCANRLAFHCARLAPTGSAAATPASAPSHLPRPRRRPKPSRQPRGMQPAGAGACPVLTLLSGVMRRDSPQRGKPGRDSMISTRLMADRIALSCWRPSRKCDARLGQG